MSEWKEVKLCDVSNIQTGPFGSQLHKEDYVTNGTPIVTVEHLGNKVFSKQNLPCVKDSDKIRLSKYILKQGDIVFSRVGSVDRCSFVTKETDGWMFSGRCLRVRPYNINPEYLYYFFTLSSTKKTVRSIAVGTTMPSINTTLLSNIVVRFPKNKEEQHTIASILSSLDDKIAINRRICENLEAQAQALFKHWFIDFAPFKNGNFVESELGMIPEGWRVGTLGEIVNQVKKKVGNINARVLSPINTGELVLSDEFFTKQVYSKSISKYIVVEPNDFAYNPARVNIGSIGRNEFDFIGCVSPVYVVFHCQKHYHYYIDFIKNTLYFKKNVNKLAIGGVRQTLRYEDMARIPIVIPPVDIVISYNDIYESMYSYVKQLHKESSRLSTLRDTLLPKLMSGQIKV